MDLVASVEVPVSVEKLFDYVSDLANYSSWLEFVHKVELVGESIETDATWLVELRAKLLVRAVTTIKIMITISTTQSISSN